MERETLFIVTRSRFVACAGWVVMQQWVFRTRAAARQFKKDKEARKNRKAIYGIHKATWGPEQ